MTFVDRSDAGAQLGRLVQALRGTDVVVLGLPRGGVPVAYEVGRALGAPVDVIVVRKLGVPEQPELAMGAIGEGGVRVVQERVRRLMGISADVLSAVEARERAELDRRAEALRGARPAIPLAGRTVLIVDDGAATGSTAQAACQVARSRGAARVLVGLPVASGDALAALRAVADEVYCVLTPSDLFAIGEWYGDFTPTTDEQVRDLLIEAGYDSEVLVSAGEVRLPGHLTVPAGAIGVVVFVHGSGSSRHSPRNQFVASVLRQHGLGTLLFDLLTSGEEADRANVFDIGLLSERLTHATAWLREQPQTGQAQIGWFGASTGAAAALAAAAQPGADVNAIVSRGGRPDLAGSALEAVRAPTLLLVGGRDPVVLDLNRQAQARLRCHNELIVVPGATHLFDEPGTLAMVAEHASDWFGHHLRPVAYARPSAKRH